MRGRGEGGPEGGFEVRHSAGVEIVVHEGPAESLALVEELRLGAVDTAREELLFYNIRDILLDDEGRIFVGNDQTATVRVFDAEGEFVREFGGKGRGPSEIPYMLNDLMWAGDRLAVIDRQGGGKTILFDTFRPEGRFRGTVTLPPRFQPMAVSEHTVVGVLKDDLDVEQVVRFGIVDGAGGEAG